MPVEEILKFIPPHREDLEIAIASREAKGAVRYNEPSYRHLGGRGINFIIQALILPGLNDTQCGFKCFRVDVAEKIFSLETLNGWSFDIELRYSLPTGAATRWSRCPLTGTIAPKARSMQFATRFE